MAGLLALDAAGGLSSLARLFPRAALRFFGAKRLLAGPRPEGLVSGLQVQFGKEVPYLFSPTNIGQGIGQHLFHISAMK